MAFDAETTERTVTRDRVMRLRDFLKALPDERLDMSNPFYDECGTPCCILGWGRSLFGQDLSSEALGLSGDQLAALIMPNGWMASRPADPHFTTRRVVAVLDHLLATGEIDWSVAK